MKWKRRYLWLGLLIIILLVIVYGYIEYNRKPADLTSVKSQASTDAISLVRLYESDEQKANGLYLGKPVDVTGIIAEINNQHDTLVNIMLGKQDALHRVSCLLDVNYVKQTHEYKPGDTITLRGICTGYLMDVELNRCVVIK